MKHFFRQFAAHLVGWLVHRVISGRHTVPRPRDHLAHFRGANDGLDALDPRPTSSGGSQDRRRLIPNVYRQVNLVSYRWCDATNAELAPLDDKIDIGALARLTFRILTLANEVGPNCQLFRDPMKR